tara:strand:- start:1745 stop:2317 length:573 start_codon:yes stop_codon:yes gene_type:complete
MVDLTDNELREFGLRTSRPIPGESLTGNPETPWPWETPPEFTTKDDALEYFLELFQQPERYQAIIESLEEDVPVMDLVQLFLTQSFQEGQINPDLMLMLVEPLAFMIMALGEKAGIENINISEDPDDPDEDEDDEDEQFSKFKDIISTIKKPQDDEDFKIEEKLDEVIEQNKLPSLMEKPKPSLLTKGES